MNEILISHSERIGHTGHQRLDPLFMTPVRCSAVLRTYLVILMTYLNENTYIMVLSSHKHADDLREVQGL